MAEPIEVEIKVSGTGEAASQLNTTASAVENLGAKTNDSTISLSSMVTGWNQAVELFGRVIGVAGAAAQAIGEFAEQAETLAGLANNLGVSINEAARRTGGMVTNLELMEAATRLSARGLNLTEHELANLAVAAERMKGQGLDATIDSVGGALVRGADRMHAFGFETTGTANMLQELETRFGDVEEGANSSLGAVVRFRNGLSNLRDELTLDIAQSSALKRSIDDLIHVFDSDLDGSALMRSVGRGMPIALAALVDQLRHLTQGTMAYLRNDFVAALREFGQVGLGGLLGDIDRRTTDELQGELSDATSLAGRTAAEQRRRALAAEAAGFETQGPPLSGRGRRRGSGGAAGGRGRDMGAEFDAAQGFEQEGMVSEIAPHGGLQGAASGPDKDAIAEGEEALRSANNAAKSLAESMGHVTQQTERSSEAMDALGSIAEGLESTFADVFTAIVEGESVSMAAVLKKIGHEMIADGTLNVLKGAGMLLTLNPAGAALIGVGAAEIAAGVGLGAAAGGGGAASGGGAAAAPAQRPERDNGGQHSGSNGGGNVTINYNTPVPNEQIGRQQDTARRAAERRWGRVAA